MKARMPCSCAVMLCSTLCSKSSTLVYSGGLSYSKLVAPLHRQPDGVERGHRVIVLAEEQCQGGAKYNLGIRIQNVKLDVGRIESLPITVVRLDLHDGEAVQDLPPRFLGGLTGNLHLFRQQQVRGIERVRVRRVGRDLGTHGSQADETKHLVRPVFHFESHGGARQIAALEDPAGADVVPKIPFQNGQLSFRASLLTPFHPKPVQPRYYG